jgi:DNA-binding transcriptional MerR regulator
MTTPPKLKKTFKIGDLSRLFNIGADSIRYYERLGLLHPVRDPKSNYRLYTLDDIRAMNTIRELLALGFHTDDNRQFEANRNLDSVTDLLTREIAAVDRKIAALKKTRTELSARLTSIREDLAKDCSGKIQRLTLPERPCLMIKDAPMPDEMISYELARASESFPEKIASIGCCDCYTLDTSTMNTNGSDYRTKNVFFYSPYLNLPSNHTLPAGDYLSVCYRGAFNQSVDWVPKLFKAAEDQGLDVTGDPMEFCHIDRFETADQDEYLTEIQLPVADKSEEA